jgi:homoserine acetyltransferase
MASSGAPNIEDLKIQDDYQTYKLGNFALKSGGEIHDAFIAYKTLGDPSSPAIIYPTWYSGCASASISLFSHFTDLET